MELKKLLKCTAGDILILDDFNSLEELGKALEAEITSVSHYRHEEVDVEYTALNVESGDLEMTLLIKTVGDVSAIRMFCNWMSGTLQEFMDTVPSDAGENNALPSIFGVCLSDDEDEDEEDEYVADEPYPLYGFFKDGGQACGIGEYTFNGEADSTYCSKYAFMEWYLSPDEDNDDLDSWFSMSFGWDVGLDDLNVIQG